MLKQCFLTMKTLDSTIFSCIFLLQQSQIFDQSQVLDPIHAGL